MTGIVIIIVALVIVIPVGFLMSTSVAAGVLGTMLKDNAEKADPDSELIATNR